VKRSDRLTNRPGQRRQAFLCLLATGLACCVMLALIYSAGSSSNEKASIRNEGGFDDGPYTQSVAMRTGLRQRHRGPQALPAIQDLSSAGRSNRGDPS